MSRALAIVAIVLVLLASMAIVFALPARAGDTLTPEVYPPVAAEIQAWCESEGGCLWASRLAIERTKEKSYAAGFGDGRADGDLNCPSRVDFKYRYGDFMH